MSENPYEWAAASLMVNADVEVRKYRTSMSGSAYKDRTIATPRARGAISFAVLAHEVGHVVLDHHHNSEPRWVEEVEAWEYALHAVETFGLKGYDKVYRRAAQCIAYAFGKAIRRGVKPETISERFPVWWRETLG
jgi:hypothetical protein